MTVRAHRNALPDKRLLRGSGLLFCAAAIGAFASSAWAFPNGVGSGELWNEGVQPSGNPIGFEVDFSGDLTDLLLIRPGDCDRAAQ